MSFFSCFSFVARSICEYVQSHFFLFGCGGCISLAGEAIRTMSTSNHTTSPVSTGVLLKSKVEADHTGASSSNCGSYLALFAPCHANPKRWELTSPDLRARRSRSLNRACHHLPVDSRYIRGKLQGYVRVNRASAAPFFGS
ncbi:hypothetical protein GQ53DRAFT_244341 [Thozetella sp. PMI_491]|nr:hypothetical protein GQ53DRAFT_244341 [Thozetella sp. PMI_491]